MDGQIYEKNTEVEIKVGDENAVKSMEETRLDKEDTQQYVDVERPYELRLLKDSDLFLLLKILKRIGIKDFKDAFIQSQSDKEAVSGKEVVRNIGILTTFDIVDMLLGNLDKIEEELYILCSDLSGISIDEIREMEFGTMPLMLLDMFTNVRNSSFFKVLSKFLS